MPQLMKEQVIFGGYATEHNQLTTGWLTEQAVETHMQ